MRKALIICGKLAALILALSLIIVLGALVSIQTKWFREQLRERTISAVQDASGGRVELRGFSYDWRSLSASFSDFVVHGTEPPQSPPLFRAARIDVRLRILSVLERRIAVSSVVLDRPAIYILVHQDGTTNIPTPAVRGKTVNQTVEELLNLKLRHFELRHGIIRTDVQELPLDLKSEDTAVVLTYDRSIPRYRASVSSHQLVVHPADTHAVVLAVQGSLFLARNTLAVESSEFASQTSTVRAFGIVRDFSHPVTDLHVAADVSANELGRIADIPELRTGRLGLMANVHREAGAPFQLSGQLVGRDLSVRGHGYDFSNCNLSSQLTASRHYVALKSLRLSVPWGHLTGEAALKDYRDFTLDSRVSSVRLIEAEKFLFNRTLPWSGFATGNLQMTGMTGSSFRNFDIHAIVDVASAASGPALAGHIDVRYRQAADTVDFGESVVDLPHTRLAASGRVDQQLKISFDTSDFRDVEPLFKARHVQLLPGGHLSFSGLINGRTLSPTLVGVINCSRFSALGETWDALHGQATLSSSQVIVSGLSIASSAINLSGNVQLPLTNWQISRDSPAAAQLTFRDASIFRLATVAHLENLPIQGGFVSGSLNLNGRVADPAGTAQLRLRDVRIHNQPIGRASVDLALDDRTLRFTNGIASNGSANLHFFGAYTHQPDDWSRGQIAVKADSNSFPLSSISLAQRYEPSWSAQVEAHLDGAADIRGGHLEPTFAKGSLALRQIAQDREALGDVSLDVSTQDQLMYAGFAGDLKGTSVKGSAEVGLRPDAPAKGHLEFSRFNIRTLYSLVNAAGGANSPVDGYFKGDASFEGPLQDPGQIRASIRLDDLDVSTLNLPAANAEPNSDRSYHLRNTGPLQLDVSNGTLQLRQFRIAGRDTDFSLAGSVALLPTPSLDLTAKGNADLSLLQAFQPGLKTSGTSAISVAVRGKPIAPVLEGSLAIHNGTLFTTSFPTGLTAINGLVRFNRQRASIENFTAQTGGGAVSMGGFVDFSTPGPWIYRLDGRADSVRLRYANSISITANADVHLSGTRARGVLSGSATVSRVVFTPNADVGTLLAASFTPPTSATNKKGDFLSDLQLDVRLESAPDLQVTTQLSRDVQAEIDLRLRGTLDHPILLGDIVANQGDIKIFGGKYSINRGEIRFANSARIEPVLDLDLQTVARGITVDVTIAGTLGKLNINYRSDPPLQPRDIIALLTVGRAPDTATTSPNVQSTSDVAAMQYGANTVLGQAISPVSSRISKLFGITNIKIDPLVQGITNAPQARVTLEQQVSREITVTYVTNLSQTSEQIFRLEWAFSPQYSIVALRDDNGEFGIDIQYRKRFK